ncbi:hypothetical protein CHELA40_10143 [Chelatococcus asaccharovorans]|nr:hypothetical protein CHELA40_10143 [Chelatococcus asaccharovorans]
MSRVACGGVIDDVRIHEGDHACKQRPGDDTDKRRGGHDAGVPHFRRGGPISPICILSDHVLLLTTPVPMSRSLANAWSQYQQSFPNRSEAASRQSLARGSRTRFTRIRNPLVLPYRHPS